jgi:YD repeat-containing protein
LSDGRRSYSWDAENRLVGITYPGTSGKATTFSYDGLDRRTAIARTPAGGGSAVATSYLWCGSAICQARDATNDVTREYYAEGELVPGASPATYYYGADQIGTVRRVFASTSSALKCELFMSVWRNCSPRLSLTRPTAALGPNPGCKGRFRCLGIAGSRAAAIPTPSRP